MKKVLFLCTGNSCRSQMAEALLRHFAGDNFTVFSAGTKPSSVNPNAVKVIAEIGIDMSNHSSKSVEEWIGQDFDYVITVCDNANDVCPSFPGNTQRLHWSFPDPAKAEGSTQEILDVFRKVRDAIKEKIVQQFIKGDKHQ